MSGCGEAFLCEDCFAALEADKAGRTALPVRRFCDRDHDDYVKAPVEGWRGVKDGVMLVAGGKSLPFADFIKRTQTGMCKAAWAGFWAAV